MLVRFRECKQRDSASYKPINTACGHLGHSHSAMSTSKVKQWFSTMTSGNPVAHVSKRRAEDFWPSTLDNEAMRAAQILRSYFMDGFIVGSTQTYH